MRKLSHAEILKERLSPEELLIVERFPIYIMVIDVRSLYNVGSIFRTADSARVKELILCGHTPHPPRKEIEKTALGAVDSVPWSYLKNASEKIQKLQADGVKVIAVEITNNKRAYSSLKKDDYPLCLVLGNELTGLSNEILKLCDDAIEIPMYGTKHSLNVSVAAGIVILEAVRILQNI